jgi:hypothetical protein
VERATPNKSLTDFRGGVLAAAEQFDQVRILSEG